MSIVHSLTFCHTNSLLHEISTYFLYLVVGYSFNARMASVLLMPISGTFFIWPFFIFISTAVTSWVGSCTPLLSVGNHHALSGRKRRSRHSVFSNCKPHNSDHCRLFFTVSVSKLPSTTNSENDCDIRKRLVLQPTSWINNLWIIRKDIEFLFTKSG